jgi:hypothetical protein
VRDLTTARSILEKPPIESTIEETVAARQMWTWYLEYGKDDDLKALAAHCEAACSSLSKWRLQDFFRFDTDEALAPEINRVAKLLREATDSQPFIEFFSAVKTYLSAARAGGQDMADSIRMTSLADALYDAFVPTGISKDEQNPITKYVASVLGEAIFRSESEGPELHPVCRRLHGRHEIEVENAFRHAHKQHRSELHVFRRRNGNPEHDPRHAQKLKPTKTRKEPSV